MSWRGCALRCKRRFCQKLRGEWTVEKPKSKRGSPSIVITSIPFAVKRSSIMEKIADDDYRMQTMITEIVTSYLFTQRRIKD